MTLTAIILRGLLAVALLAGVFGSHHGRMPSAEETGLRLALSVLCTASPTGSRPGVPPSERAPSADVDPCLLCKGGCGPAPALPAAAGAPVPRSRPRLRSPRPVVQAPGGSIPLHQRARSPPSGPSVSR